MQFSEIPHLFDVTKIVGEPYFRLRVGDYRVIFDIQNDKLRIIEPQANTTIQLEIIK
jgi:mRNA-degrading endonuclease RelE of RelBE toxin-antitoxin system